MLYLSILLHIYQPPTQFVQITKEITESSYRLILKILKKSKAKITLNINASLTEQLARLGGEDVIRGISDLARNKQIEFTGSAAYHPLLPRLPQDLMRRQITLNTKINRKYFGELYCPNGFFPPEMAYGNTVGEVLEELGFDYVVVDEHAYPGRVKKRIHDVIYVRPSQTVIARRDPSLSLRAKRSNLNDSSGQAPQSQTEEIATAAYGGLAMTRKKPLNVFFRNDDLSLSIAFSRITTLSQFIKLAKSYELKANSYIIIALDGETFGHHQLGQDKLLFDILSYKSIKIVTINELKKYFHKERVIRPLTSCWGASDDDMRKKIYWPRWSYPGNPIHKLQWELTKLVIKNQNDESTLFDKSLHSDQYWWASHKPYWHPEMIRRGAEMLVKTLKENPDISDKTRKQGERLYCDIVETIHKTYGEVIIST